MTGRVYASEDAALARVEVLKRHGYWPGIRHVAGGWIVLYDPWEVFR